MCREQGTARSRERWLQVLDGVSRQRAVYVRVRQGVPGELNFVGGPLLMSGGVCATVGGNESSHRESGLSFLPRRRAVGARNRASAGPRRGGDAAVPSYEARRRRSPSGRVSPHRDERDNLAAPKSSGAAVTSCERRRWRSARRPSGRRAVEACWLRTAKSPTSLCRFAP